MSTKKKTKSTSERKSPPAKEPLIKKPRPELSGLILTNPPELDKPIMDLIDLFMGRAMHPRSEAERVEVVTVVRNVAVYAANCLETLYSMNPKGLRAVVEAVALKSRYFVQAYDLSAPPASSKKVQGDEDMRDLMRRELTKLWSHVHLRVKRVDHAQEIIQGFYTAVVQNTVKDWDEYRGENPVSLVVMGLFPVPEQVRSELRAHRDAGKWAHAFVDFYEELHPWPFRDDKTGKLTWPNSDQEANGRIRDPFHQIAYDRLMKRQKRNPDYKSPLNALREVVRDRFRSYFKGLTEK